VSKIKLGEAEFKTPWKRTLAKVIKKGKWFIKYNWAGATPWGFVLAADPTCQESTLVRSLSAGSEYKLLLVCQDNDKHHLEFSVGIQHLVYHFQDVIFPPNNW